MGECFLSDQALYTSCCNLHSTLYVKKYTWLEIDVHSCEGPSFACTSLQRKITSRVSQIQPQTINTVGCVTFPQSRELRISNAGTQVTLSDWFRKTAKDCGTRANRTAGTGSLCPLLRHEHWYVVFGLSEGIATIHCGSPAATTVLKEVILRQSESPM